MSSGNTGALTGQRLGGYLLTGLLGAGGMAEVYRGHDPSLGRDVAVKVLPASLATDPGYVERFRDEARRVGTLSHPNVVPVYQYGEERGLLFLVMPLLKESLRDRIQRSGQLPIATSARLVVQVAAALDAAHSQGIVHRDVKPENIMLNADGKALLTDFGIARDASFLRQTGTARTLAASGLPVGTPEYMAPEQLRAQLVDHRADIYALGAVLYELLTGVAPHEAATPYEVAALTLTSPTTPPSARNAAIWPELERVTMKALAPEPGDRYQDARSFALALRDAVQRRDVTMPRVTVPASSFMQALVASAAPGDVDRLVAHGAASGALVDAPLPLPSTPEGDGANDFPLQAQPLPPQRGWRSRFYPGPALGRKRRRLTLVLVGALVLALTGVCVGGGLAVLGNFSLPGGATSPGLGGATFGSTPGASVTETAGSVAAATAGAQATVSAAATATVAEATATAGAVATKTAQPTATATLPPPPPASLSFSSSISQNNTSQNNTTCSGSVAITNTGHSAVTWRWTAISPSMPKNFFWMLNSASGFNSLPSDNAGLASNSTETVNVSYSCKSAAPNTVTVVDGDGHTYNPAFSLAPQGG